MQLTDRTSLALFPMSSTIQVQVHFIQNHNMISFSQKHTHTPTHTQTNKQTVHSLTYQLDDVTELRHVVWSFFRG